jgi:hypothetical protein
MQQRPKRESASGTPFGQVVDLLLSPLDPPNFYTQQYPQLHATFCKTSPFHSTSTHLKINFFQIFYTQTMSLFFCG